MRRKNTNSQQILSERTSNRSATTNSSVNYFPSSQESSSINRLNSSRKMHGYFLGGYVPPGTPNWHPVLKKKSLKIDTPFQKWADFIYPVLEFALKLIPHSRNGPIFYTPFQKVCKLKQPCFLKRYFFICSTYTSNKCFFIISNNFKQKIKP